MKKGKMARVSLTIIKLVCALLVFLMGISLVIGCVLGIYVDKKVEKSIDETLFTLAGTGSDTVLYYYATGEDGEEKAVEWTNVYGGYRYVYSDFESIPRELVGAFVSIEDKRFYQHEGVDWRRTLSAGLNYFLKFNGSYGGSTITQQLIKNVTEKDDYSLQRKIQEIFWALDLETKLSKDEILCLYLNVINLSQGCYGVGAAANYYFSKDVSELTLNECASIAAITNSPSYYDPIRNPENNKYRKDLILGQMYEQGYIDYDAYVQNKGTAVVLNVNDKFDSSKTNSWYADMVIEDVIDDLVEQYGYSRAMANLTVYRGGLKIYTAMDPEIQSILEEYYSDPSNFFSKTKDETPQSSMIIIDPHNGDILGVAGAIGEKKANRIQNFATQTLRPPGSVIKPLSVYAPAMDMGIISWSSIYDDVPVNFGNYNLDASKGRVIAPVPWPKNSTGVYRGLTDVDYAISHSINTVTVRILEDVGLKNSFDFLYDKLNMKSLISSSQDKNGAYITDMDYAALALGQLNYGVSVREITAGYSIFVSDGVYNESRSYFTVTDGYGNELLENKYRGEAVISSENASVLNIMLENVVKNGTAKDITLSERVACAGKTGTTQNNYDRWYIGYTPSYIGGVWYGYEYPKALSGSNNCIDIWDDVMTEIYSRKGIGDNDRAFSVSDNLTECEYCADSGKLMTEACMRDARGDRSKTGFFVKGSEPTEYCDCHLPVLYDNSSGGVSLYDMCEYGEIEYISMIRVERSFPMQIYVTDAQYVWREIPSDIMPETSPELPFFNNLMAKNEYCGISKTDEQFNRLCRAHFNYFEWLEKQKKAVADG